jgi:hypothetical protein
VIDSHVYLWGHQPQLPLQASIDQLAGYCADTSRLGVPELAVTEHSSSQTRTRRTTCIAAG